MTTAESDKPYKKQEHSRERSHVKQALNCDHLIPDPKEFGSRWKGPKDGKQYWAKATAKDMRK
jgi:hypothetical protein